MTNWIRACATTEIELDDLIRFDHGTQQAQNMLENTVVKSTTAGVTGAKPTYFFLERYMPAYRAEWAAFVSAIDAGSALPVKRWISGPCAWTWDEMATVWIMARSSSQIGGTLPPCRQSRQR